MTFSTYIISLNTASERRRTMTEKLNALGIDFQFFDAVDGRKFDVTSHPNYDRKKRLLFFGRDLKGGEIGCLVSHKLLLEKVAQFPDDEVAFILEDDAILNPNITRIIEKLITSPYPWELVRFLGSPKIATLRQRTVYQLDDTYRLNRLATSPGEAHAYLIRPSGARKLIPHLQHCAFPIDALMGQPWQTGVDVLTVQPSLAVQDLAIESSIGDARFNKTIEISGLARAAYPFTRGIYKFSDSLMKRVMYWGSWPKDQAFLKKNFVKR